MVYGGDYEQGRPYAGPAAPRPPPQRQYAPPPGRQQYNGPPPRQYDGYEEGYGYGYDEYDGYDQGYGQYDDQNYPPRDYYGPGPGRGSPMNGPYPPRGGGQGPRNYPPGRAARPGPPGRSGSADMTDRRRPSLGERNLSDAGVSSGPFPAFPGGQRRTELDEEQQIINRMGGMDISGQRPGPRPQNSLDSDGYGRSDRPMNGRGPPRPYPPQGFPDQRRGNPPRPGYGPSMDYDDDPGFGPPERSMTAPARDPMRNPGPPPRSDTAPYNGPVGRAVAPPRPNTAQAVRPPPQRTYPPPSGSPARQDQFQGPGYEGPPDGDYGLPQRPASFDDYYDTGEYPGHAHPPRPGSDIPSYDGLAAQPRSSLDQHMQVSSPEERAQRGPVRFPEVNRTKSQPDLRQPQAAVFEMAGDVPPIPDQYQQQGYSGAPYDDPGAYNHAHPPPPSRAAGLPNTPAPLRPGLHPPARSMPGPDSLPMHPAPIRPGLMPNSIVNPNNKPPPVRNYGAGGAPPGSSAPPPPQQPQQNVVAAAAATAIPAAPRPKPEQRPVTVHDLERLRAIIKADSNDQDSAILLAKKLIEASDVLVPQLPDPKARARARERYHMDAHKILKKLSGANNPDAMFFLADCLGRGMFGAEPDSKEAFLLYQSSAKLGHAAAAYRTAVCCEIGHEEGGGTRKDPLKAIQWYKRAATLGDPPAMYKVGMIILKGLLGQPRNPREAVGWLKRAAERADSENPHALHELALLYESAQPNDAILRDEAYALRLFKQAADLGYKFSQFRLGCAYEFGLMGCPIDPRPSIMWYSRAATQEEHQSELALSGWYLTGSEGVLQQSDTEAYLWARKAAMAGLAKAEYAMGYFTEVGIGVPASMDDAKRWYWRAAAQDFPKARERLEDLKRSGKNGPRQRERISRSKMGGQQQEGECSVM